MIAAEMGGRNSIELRVNFFSPSTQSNLEKVTLLEKKFKEGYREKEDVLGKGSPCVRKNFVGMHNSTTIKGSFVSSSLFFSTSHTEELGQKYVRVGM